MSVMRIVGQNLVLSLFSVGFWSTLAWIACLIYGWVAHAVLPGLPHGLGSYAGRALDYAMLYAINYLPAFLGGGALLGLIAAQVQFWAWFTAEQKR